MIKCKCGTNKTSRQLTGHIRSRQEEGTGNGVSGPIPLPLCTRHYQCGPMESKTLYPQLPDQLTITSLQAPHTPAHIRQKTLGKK